MNSARSNLRHALILTGWSLTCVLSCHLSAAIAADWPQWRGPERTAISPETGLLQEWPNAGPALLWTHRDLGFGYAAPAIVGDRLYVLGSEGESAIAIALDARTGERQWATQLGERFDEERGGGPRSTPTIDGERLYALDAVGNLFCLDCQSGQPVWSKSLVTDFGGKAPNWGYCESPLVDGDKVVVTPGGPKCVVALDKNTGKTIWSSSRGLQEGAHYSSFIKATVSGVAMYITMTSKGLVAVSADDGRLLWRYENTANRIAVVPTPIFHNDHVYSTSGYNTGCALVKLTPKLRNVFAKQVYFNQEMKNQHGGVLLKDDKVFGYSDGGGWLCQDFLTGEVVWRERGALGKGSIAYADNRLYCYSENEGTVVLAAASPAGWEEHGRFTIPERTQLDHGSGKTWAHPVIAGGKLFLRDQDLLFCYDISG